MIVRIYRKVVEIRALIGILNRRAELRELIHWAKRKRLRGPLRAYVCRLLDEEARLHRAMLLYPRFTLTLRWLHWIGRRVLPRPRYHRRGSAARYRACRLTPVRCCGSTDIGQMRG
jgi:hypothetical protein